MPYDTGIADRLRAWGLDVWEVDGWRSRGGSTFRPRGSVDHHTAGPASGNAPSLGICTNGRSGLPGPLCNVLVGRNLACYVIAAGTANHAGAGGWSGLSGNSSVYGVERENVGTQAEPWTPEQTIHAARVHAALADGRWDADKVCLHKEWAPGRKVDPHSIDGGSFRALVHRAMKEGPDMPLSRDDLDNIAKVVTGQDTRQGVQNTAMQVNLILGRLDKLEQKMAASGGGSVDVDAVAKRLAEILAAKLAK
jgi:hypothetical protein